MRPIIAGLLALLLASAGPWAVAAKPLSAAPGASADTDPMARQAIIQAIEMSKAEIADRKLAVAWHQAAYDRAVREDHHLLFTLYKQSVLDVILTILVLVVVFGGVYMSYMQFRADIKAGDTETISTVRISKDGVELSSSVVGLFVLLASMFFFYLYLNKVYEIKYLDAATAAAPGGQTQASGSAAQLKNP